MDKAERVEKIFMDCLFKDEEIKDGKAPSDAVLVEGLVSKFGFHPTRLASHQAEIEKELLEFDDDFYTGKGGGMTFLNFCNTKDGEQWGEHRNMEQLITLGIAIKKVKYCLPRSMWNALPGGVPYVSIDLRK